MSSLGLSGGEGDGDDVDMTGVVSSGHTCIKQKVKVLGYIPHTLPSD